MGTVSTPDGKGFLLETQPGTAQTPEQWCVYVPESTRERRGYDYWYDAKDCEPIEATPAPEPTPEDIDAWMREHSTLASRKAHEKRVKAAQKAAMTPSKLPAISNLGAHATALGGYEVQIIGKNAAGYVVQDVITGALDVAAPREIVVTAALAPDADMGHDTIAIGHNKSRTQAVARSESGNLAIVKDRNGYNVWHVPSGLKVPAFDRTAGIRTLTEARRYMRALDECEAITDDPRGVTGEAVYILRTFIGDYAERTMEVAA